MENNNFPRPPGRPGPDPDEGPNPAHAAGPVPPAAESPDRTAPPPIPDPEVPASSGGSYAPFVDPAMAPEGGLAEDGRAAAPTDPGHPERPERRGPNPVPHKGQRARHTPAESYGFVAPPDAAKTSPWVWVALVTVLGVIIAIVIFAALLVVGLVESLRNTEISFGPGSDTEATVVAGGDGAGPGAQGGSQGVPMSTDLDPADAVAEEFGTGTAEITLPEGLAPTDFIEFGVEPPAEGTAFASVTTLDTNGNELRPLGYGTAPWAGTMPLLSPGLTEIDAAALGVDAGGEWGLRVYHLDAAPLLTSEAPLSNVGPAVVRVEGSEADVDLDLEHDGESNFIVRARDAEGGSDLLVNEIGPHTETVTVPAGTDYVEVAAMGAWIATING